MPRPAENDSPFKRDEPVSRSWKWMMVLFAGFVAFLLYDIGRAIWKKHKLDDVVDMTAAYAVGVRSDVIVFLTGMWAMLFMVVIILALLVLLWRSAKMARLCGEKRSFEMMAAAVNSQRYFWAALAVTMVLVTIHSIALNMLTQPRVTLVQGWVKQRELHQKTMEEMKPQIERQKQEQRQQQQPPPQAQP